MKHPVPAARPCLPALPPGADCIPCVGTLSLCQKRSGTRIAEDAIQGPAFLEGPCRGYSPPREAGQGGKGGRRGRDVSISLILGRDMNGGRAAPVGNRLVIL
ncbi:hypothetical protein DXC97_17875 [Lachnospiraceae bacterium TF09-5]|nr:hypothetical protein DXC97_17875 [Lachnospiraceae bacterium TF09-5]